MGKFARSMVNFLIFLTLPAPCISEGCIKITKVPIFTLLCGASKGFMKAFKVFKKPVEPSQYVKIKIIFSLRPGSGRKGLNRRNTNNNLWL